MSIDDVTEDLLRKNQGWIKQNLADQGSRNLEVGPTNFGKTEHDGDYDAIGIFYVGEKEPRLLLGAMPQHELAVLLKKKKTFFWSEKNTMMELATEVVESLGCRVFTYTGWDFRPKEVRAFLKRYIPPTDKLNITDELLARNLRDNFDSQLAGQYRFVSGTFKDEGYLAEGIDVYLQNKSGVYSPIFAVIPEIARSFIRVYNSARDKQLDTHVNDATRILLSLGFGVLTTKSYFMEDIIREQGYSGLLRAVSPARKS